MALIVERMGSAAEDILMAVVAPHAKSPQRVYMAYTMAGVNTVSGARRNAHSSLISLLCVHSPHVWYASVFW